MSDTTYTLDIGKYQTPAGFSFPLFRPGLFFTVTPNTLSHHPILLHQTTDGQKKHLPRENRDKCIHNKAIS